MSQDQTQLAVPEQQLSKPERRASTLAKGGVIFQSMEDLARFCSAVVASRLAPKDFSTPEAVMVAVQHGAELGLAPMQSLQSICVINGRPSVWGDAAAALCRAHPDCVDIVEEIGDDSATCTVKRRGCIDVKRTFTVADATKASLWKKSGPWTQYPKRMLQMRARSWALRDAFPDALKGVGIREEVQDYSRQEAAKPTKGIVLPDDPKPELTAPKTEAEFESANPAPFEGAEITKNEETGEFQWS